GTGTTRYSFDELDRPLTVTNALTKTVAYRYDLDSNRRKLVYPGGSAVTYTFDKADRLSSLQDWASRTTSYGYFADGLPQTRTNVDGTTANYTYDNARRLTEVWNKNGANTLDKHTYTLDAVGNRTQNVEVIAPYGGGGAATTTIAYGYDKLYRLTSDGTTGATFGYDPVGNRASMTQGTTTSYTYDRADRLSAAGSTSYTVNADGNTTARGADSFAYDQANRLKSATLSGATSTYAYEGDGERASKTVGGATTSYVYDAAGGLPMLLDDGTTRYVYGLGLAYSVDTSANPVRVYHADGLGSVRALTDGSAALQQTYQNDAFGVVVAAGTAGTS